MSFLLQRSSSVTFYERLNSLRLFNGNWWFARSSYASKAVLRNSQLSYASNRGDHDLIGATVSDLFNKQVENVPDADMFVFHKDKVRYTFKTFKEKMDELAAGFVALGVKPGDRVGVWSSNRAEYVFTQFATAQIGAILVTINPAYRVNELEYALDKVGVSTQVMAESFKTQDYYEMIFDLCPELMRCPPGQLKSHRLPMLKAVIMMGGERKPGTLLLDDVCNMDTKDNRLKIEQLSTKLHFDQPIKILFTSGTTGNPKAATLTHHNIINNARFVGYRMGFDRHRAIICVPVPLYHAFALILGSLMSALFGSTCVFPAETFDPVTTLEAIQAERCNVLYGYPSLFLSTYNHPNFVDYDTSSLQSGAMGGSPCLKETVKLVVKNMDIPRACVAYGSTETSPVSFLSHPDAPLEKRCSSIGTLLDHTEAKIVDEEGNIVPRGVNGELCTRGYSTMLGYWEDKSKTESAISPTRWYHTGDIAMMDEEGYVGIKGRIKDMIIRGGENIYPVEIEEFLSTHPSIEDVQVVGLPDKKMGEEICACVKVKEGRSLMEQEVKDFCIEKAFGHTPRYVVFVEVFPQTVLEKVLKNELKRDLIKQLSLEHEAP